MSRIEEMLNTEKRRISQLNPPEGLEGRLERKLSNGSRVRKTNRYLAVVVAALLIFVIGFNFDALAHMTRMVRGYDGILSETLSSLNELGQGQVINETLYMGDISITIDGLMMDDSQTILFYTIHGNEDHMAKVMIKGLLGEYNPSHGMGEINKEKGEIKFVQHYEPLHFFERSLTLDAGYWSANGYVSDSVKVKIDRDKAMGQKMSMKLNKEMVFEDQEVKFDKLLVTPTQTVISGSLYSPVEMIFDELRGSRVEMHRINLALFGDGHEIDQLSGGYSSGTEGLVFEFEFETLDQISLLEVAVESLSVVEPVKETFDEMTFEVHDNPIVIEEMLNDGENTYVTFITADDVALVKPKLVSESQEAELLKTINSDYDKDENGISHKRTMVFEGVYVDFKLYIHQLKYDKATGERLILWQEQLK